MKRLRNLLLALRARPTEGMSDKELAELRLRSFPKCC